MITGNRPEVVQELRELIKRLTRDLPDAVADKVATQVNDDFAVLTRQGWHIEPIHPAWSGHCWYGDHSLCDGSASPSPECHCPHHSGEPIPEHGYRMLLDDYGDLYAVPRTGPRPRRERRKTDQDGGVS